MDESRTFMRLTGVHAKELPFTKECTQDLTWTDCMWKEIKEEGV